MPPLFWLDVAGAILGATVSAALLLITLSAGLGQPLNRAFGLFTLLSMIWGCLSVVQRVSLWIGRGDPLFAGECIALVLFLMAVSMLVFSGIYAGRSGGRIRFAAALGLAVVAASVAPLFRHAFLSNPRLHPNGTTLVDVGPAAWLLAAHPVFFLGASFLVLWRDRKRTGATAMALSALVMAAGLVTGGVIGIHVPVQSFTHTAGIAILGYGVLSRQVFNPLRRTTESLREQIVERERVEQALRFSLNEKEVLLREIHHRVGNNLQVISSLLHLQALKVRSPKVRDLFADSRNRILSMSLVHEQLYQGSRFTEIPLDAYVRSLAGRLLRSHAAARDRVRLVVKTAGLNLTLDTAIPCGLLVNEIISNSLKHAFPPGFEARPVISVKAVRTAEGRVALEVADNGVGLKAGRKSGGSAALGMELIRILAVEQLGGTLEMEGTKGTKVRITFPA